MDPSPQVLRGPMTRSRARALETEVNSLLVEFPFDHLETWLLPQMETLCMLRCQGEVTVQDGCQEHELGFFPAQR